VSFVCHQLNTEANDLPHKLNTFQISLGGLFDIFLARLKDEKKKLISTVSFGFKPHRCITDMRFVDLTVPKRLVDCTGIKTVISRVTLGDCRKPFVKEYAESVGAKLVYENKHLGCIDDHEDEQMEAIYNEW
jgi:hypothetical protein